jgi:ubiquinone/menaquinone biosynthesis C-methylase UbiE
VPENTGFSNERFDRMAALNILYFFDEPMAALTEIKRVLKPGGKAAFYLTDKNSMAAAAFARPEVYKRYTGDESAALLTDCDFSNVTVTSKEVTSVGRRRTGHCVIGSK